MVAVGRGADLSHDKAVFLKSRVLKSHTAVLLTPHIVCSSTATSKRKIKNNIADDIQVPFSNALLEAEPGSDFAGALKT